MSLYTIETKKYKGLHMLEILLLAIGVEIIFAGVDLGRFRMGKGDPHLIWYQLIQTNAFIKMIFMPVLLATFASISVQLENRQQMWKMIYIVIQIINSIWYN